MKIVLLVISLALCSCATKRAAEDRPRPSTAAIGVSLDSLERSIGGARGDLGSVTEGLSEVDAKAVRIQEAIRKW